MVESVTIAHTQNIPCGFKALENLLSYNRSLLLTFLICHKPWPSEGRLVLMDKIKLENWSKQEIIRKGKGTTNEYGPQKRPFNLPQGHPLKPK